MGNNFDKKGVFNWRYHIKRDPVAGTGTAPASARENKIGWNVSIFMAADNNLSEESIWAIEEIKKNAMPQVPVEILIHLMTPSRIMFNPNDSDFIRGERPSPHEELNKNKLITKLIEENKPSNDNKSILVLSGHGNGALGDFLSGQGKNGLSDEDVYKPLGIKESGEALRVALAGAKLNILGLDSCLMGMIEVCYEFRNHADFLIAHQGYERNTGWPFCNVINSICMESYLDNPRNLAFKIVKEYMDYYTVYKLAGISVDIAACDLGKFVGPAENKPSALITAVKELAGSLKNGMVNKDVLDSTILAHWRSQSYNNEQYVDLWDFCYLLCEQLKDKKDKEDYKKIYDHANEVMVNINGDGHDGPRDKKYGERAVLISCYSGPAFQHSHGLSVYFPWERSAVENELKQYNELEFSDTTKWGEFLEEYLKRSQRESRGKDSHGPSYKDAGIGRPREIRIPLTDISETDVRSNPKLNTRSNPELNTKGGINIGIWVKNHCDTYYEYDSECDISKLNTPGGT